MAYRKCLDCGLTLDLNDENDDYHWDFCPGRPVIGHTPAGEPLREGDAVCDNCGNIAHTEAEFALCSRMAEDDGFPNDD